MDIIDIMLARALTPQGQVETYAAKAQRAAQQAAQAQSDAQAAIETVNSAASSIAEKQSAAEELLSTAQETLETAQEAQINALDIEDVDDEINKMTVNTNVVDGQNAKTIQVISTYPDNTLNTQNITKLYKETGTNEDGTMTQKAITTALDTKADTATLNSYATTAYVNNAIANIPSGGGSGGSINTNLGSENAGKIVIIDATGKIISGVVTEEDIIAALIQSGGYVAKDAVGIEADYENKSFTRTQQAVNKAMGTDFDSYTMYGGRKRCIVDNNGTIICFEGEARFNEMLNEDANEYSVMIYQPKFYYQRVPLAVENGTIGKIIKRDSITVSAVAQNGFKLHPLFKDTNGEELDYVLLSAFEGGVCDSEGETSNPDFVNNINNILLTSQYNYKPVTGSQGLTLARAEAIAANRGEGWHIMNIAAESANQMLESIEFGTMNGQQALGKGICDIESVGNKNQSALTGSTRSLGSTSGAAAETEYELDGSYFTLTGDGKVAISYRGLENPWGNTWNMLGGILVNGVTSTGGGVPYICSDFYYSYTSPSSNYQSVEFTLPNNNGWISALGYGNKDYDWVLMPAASDSSANSALPIGDNGWFDSNMSGNRAVVVGGSWGFGESDGPFYYGCDKAPNDTSYKSYGARLMFIPAKNNIYNANIAKWQQMMNIGG